jgi:hypothetical protein
MNNIVISASKRPPPHCIHYMHKLKKHLRLSLENARLFGLETAEYSLKMCVLIHCSA